MTTVVSFGPDYVHGTLLTTVDAQELAIAREVGVRHHAFLRAVRMAYDKCMANPAGHGDVRALLILTRPVTIDNVMYQHAEQVDLPPEMLQWPS